MGGLGDGVRPGGVGRRIGRLAERRRDLRRDLKLVHQVNAVQDLRGRRVARVASFGRQPVPDEVHHPAAAGLTVAPEQHVVGGIRQERRQPLLDHRVVRFQHALVAVLQIHVPRQGDREPAPHRSAGGAVVVRSRIRDAARLGILGIAPVREPGVVQAARLEGEHSGLDRGAAIAAVALPLARGAVHDHAAKRERFVRAVDHPVDLVQQLVGRREIARAVVRRADHLSGRVRHGRGRVDADHPDVAERVVVEAGPEGQRRAVAHDFIPLVEACWGAWSGFLRALRPPAAPRAAELPVAPRRRLRRRLAPRAPACSGARAAPRTRRCRSRRRGSRCARGPRRRVHPARRLHRLGAIRRGARLESCPGPACRAPTGRSTRA